MAENGKKGGTARAKNLTKEALTNIGRQGALKRWKNKALDKDIGVVHLD